jgi:hypothetical protein
MKREGECMAGERTRRKGVGKATSFCYQFFIIAAINALDFSTSNDEYGCTSWAAKNTMTKSLKLGLI